MRKSLWNILKRYTPGMSVLLLTLMLGPLKPLWADTLPMTLVGATDYLGSYYVAPYQVSIGGTTYNVICDDAYDNVYVGEKWNATTETISNLNGALFTQGYLNNNLSQSISQSQAYAEAGWLAGQINANQGTAAGAEYQYALWDVFDPGFSNTSGTLSNGEPGADLTSGEQSAVDADLLAAESDYSNCPTCSNVVIYTPTPEGPGEPQEYLGVGTPQATAEPSSLLLLGTGLMALVGMRWRRNSQTGPSLTKAAVRSPSL